MLLAYFLPQKLCFMPIPLQIKYASSCLFPPKYINELTVQWKNSSCYWSKILLIVNLNNSSTPNDEGKNNMMNFLSSDILISHKQKWFQLYRGGQFYWWRKQEYTEKKHLSMNGVRTRNFNGDRH